jgi:protein-S-isoprenylcysteine O-methyltransferase Ste14
MKAANHGMTWRIRVHDRVVDADRDHRPAPAGMSKSFARAVLAFIALPGVVAYIVPVLLGPTPPEASAWAGLGIATIITGTTLLLLCVREFYLRGKGTLAPWSPPRHLVTSGPYQWSRNPMYVAVLLVLIGWCMLSRTRALYAYTAAIAVAFHLRILLYEESRLKESFGEEWARYTRETRRWVGLEGLCEGLERAFRRHR